MLGYESGEIVGRNVFDLIHPEDLNTVRTTFRQNVDPLEESAVEFRFKHRAGSWCRLEATGTKLLGRAAESGVVVNCRNITYRKQVISCLEKENRLLERIATGSSDEGLFKEIAAFVEEESDDVYCAILFVNPALNRLRLRAAPRLPSRFTKRLETLDLGASGWSCAAAIERQSQVISSDIASDPIWSAENDWIRTEHGFHACWSTPFFSQKGDVLGTIAIYAKKPRPPSQYELMIIETATCLTKIATERQRSQEKLRESEKRYVLAARGAKDGLWDWDIDHGVIEFSSRWKEMLGWTETGIGSQVADWYRLIHPEDRERTQQEIERHLQGETDHFECEHRIQHRDGSYRWVLCRALAFRDDNGNPTRMAGSQTDITKRKETEEQLRHNALHDMLTGLPNRAMFMDLLGRLQRRALRREGISFAVLFLDLDRFKLINDSLGHAIGDKLLQAVARRLEACVRPGDIVSRLGGDEFTVLLTRIQSESGVTSVAERINEELRAPYEIDGRRIYVTTSIGIAMGSSSYASPEDVLRDADIAMYRAKVQGKARFEVFDETMHAQVMARLQLETDLRKAIEKMEFKVHYQPIVSLNTDSVVGFEALLRWQHPDRGLLSAPEFLSVAEETDLILPIGWAGLRKTCSQIKHWQSQGDALSSLKVGINLSSKQFYSPNLFENIEWALRDSELAPNNLTLEIPESVVMGNVEAAIDILSKLKSLGVFVQLDEFGTGYSSLSQLHRLKIDCLKIDRRFVSDMESAESQITVRTVLNLAESLRMDVIAVGVEDPLQLAQLRKLKCKFAQGELFSLPVPPKEAVKLLAKPFRLGPRLVKGESAS
jgi:diguanylate cyclase (GGDEF)-like protein/PAS domain S-box-containing protein